MPIRALERRDLPAIVELYRRAFEETAPVSDDRLVAYFEQIFFDHPWYSPDFPSLVLLEGDQINGFLGVTPRRLVLDGQPLTSAISSHFMVDPDRRRSLAGVRLMQEFFRGRQDLSIAEGNDSSKRIWAKLGGEVSVLHSIHWVSPLRPIAYALSRRRSTVSRLLLRRLGTPLDILLARSRGVFRRSAPPRLREERLEIATFLLELERVSAPFRLRPVYDRDSASWLFALLERKRKLGRLRRSLLTDRDGEHAGWCIWFERRGGISQLVQVGAAPERALDVHDWLSHAAWRAGSIALGGRLNPEYLRAQAHHVAVLSREHSWMLLHARDPALLAAIQAGHAFMTRLETEFWIPFDEA